MPSWIGKPTPLYQKPTFLAYSSTLEGVEDNATQSGPLWNSERWTVSCPQVLPVFG